MNRDNYDLPLTTASDRAAAHLPRRRRLHAVGLARRRRGPRPGHRRGSRFRAGACGARPCSSDQHGRRPRRAPWRRRRGSWPPAQPRERQHVEIMAAMIERQPKGHDRRRTASRGISARRDDPVAAARRLRSLRLLRPRRPRCRELAICERHAGDYGEDWWFLTYLGWSHTEAGHPVTGRALTERAFALRAANANAAHGLSHALFEQGEAEGRAFLTAWLPAHDRISFLHGHLCLARGADRHSKRTIPTGARNLRAAYQAGRPALSAAEHLDRRRFAALANVARRPDRARAALAGDRRLRRAIFPAGRRAFRRPASRIGRGGDKRRSHRTRLAQMEARPPPASWRPGRRRSASAAASRLSPTATVTAPFASSSRCCPNWCGSAAAMPSANCGKTPSSWPACAPDMATGASLISDRLHRRPSERDHAWLRQAERHRA